jgi:hypothetical protein
VEAEGLIGRAQVLTDPKTGDIFISDGASPLRPLSPARRRAPSPPGASTGLTRAAGYGNSAVHKLKADGTHIKSWGASWVIPDCHFQIQLNHFIPGLLSYTEAVFLK